MPIKKSIVQNYDNWVRRKESIADLFLDLENIRLQVEGQTSQDALINDLFLNEDAMQTLESIATNGFFPDEIPVVIRENKKLVVIDGNRRVAALKVLLHPEIVPSKETKIRELIKSAGPLIKEMEVVLAPDRDSVRHFLASKHTHDTRRPWRPLRQAYFYKAELARGKTVQDLRKEYPNVDIDKFLKLINIHRIAKSIQYDSDQVTKKVHNERTFPASTIGRLYEDKRVRNFLGFDFDKNGEVKIQISKKEFEKGFKKIVQDVVDKIVDSRSLNTEKNRKDYLATFSKAEIPNKTKSGGIITSKDFKETIPLTIKKKTKLAPRDIDFTLQCPGVGRMLSELQKIDYHKFPNASHDLLRSFLECALKAYFYQKGTQIKPAGKFVYLNDVLREFKKEMDSTKNIELSQVTQRIISNTNMNSYSVQFLNAVNHNSSVFAIAKDVEDAWDTMEKLFRYILNPKKKQDDKDNI
ncbi:MAG: ParB/Srx family N-terminal domain-containing protein [Candidatus Firestonebacteria bacterium]